MLGKRRTANESLIFPSESQWVEPPSPSDRSDAEYTFDISKDDTTGEVAAGTFNRYGMCIAKGLVSEATANKAYEGAKQVYDSLIEKMKANGLPALGIGTKQGYAEIVQRTKGRFEINYGMDQPEFPSKEYSNAWLNSFLPAAFGSGEYTLARRSILISFPGAQRQQWHVDGGHLSCARHLRPHAINVFVALCSIDANMGPTEIRPASQFLTRKLTSMMLAAKARKQLHAPVQLYFQRW